MRQLYLLRKDLIHQVPTTDDYKTAGSCPLPETQPCTRCQVQNKTLYQAGLCKRCLHKDFARLRPLLSVKSSSTMTIRGLQ